MAVVKVADNPPTYIYIVMYARKNLARQTDRTLFDAKVFSKLGHKEWGFGGVVDEADRSDSYTNIFKGGFNLLLKNYKMNHIFSIFN